MAYKRIEKFPPDVGAAIDLLYAMRAKRLALEKDVEAMKQDEASLKAYIIQGLQSVKLQSGRGAIATGSIRPKHYCRVADGGWPKFWAWARRDAGGNYVEKRAASTAVLEYLDVSKKGVPGVETGSVLDLSLTKAG